MFIHDISLKHNPETTATNLFQASLLRRVVVELHFSLERNYGLLVKLIID